MEKVIGLKITLKGAGDALSQLEQIVVPIQETKELLADIQKRNKAIDELGKKIKSLTKDMERLNAQLKGGKGGSTGLDQVSKGYEKVKKEAAAAVSEQSRLRRELDLAGKGSARYNELIKQLATLKQKQSEVNAEIREQQRAFETAKFAVGSYRQLNAELGRAREAYRGLSEAERNSAIGKQSIANIQRLDTELKKIDGQMGIFTRNVGNYQSALSGLGAVTQRFFALTGAAFSVDAIIRNNAKISDSIADVAKTAGASIPAIERLSEQLEFRDTRTSIAEQLGIAEIGGRLSIAEDALYSFTAAVDVLNVALGDQFKDAEDLTDQIGRLRNTLTTFKTNDVAGDILRLGNALNVLEADGVATAVNIVDISSRLAGLAENLGLTADEIIGLSATLDELNIAPERAATAIQKVLGEIARAPEVFAQFSGKNVQEFTKLVNEDLVGAFTLVLNGIKQSDQTTTEFIKTLDVLGLDGERAIEVFAKLGSSTDLLTQRIAQSRIELQRTDSLYAEFNKKNATLGAELEKLGNTIINLFTGSAISNGLAGFIRGIRGAIDSVTGLLNPTQKLSKQFEDVTGRVTTLDRELPGLLARYDELRRETDPTKKEQEELGSVIKRIGKLTPTAITEVDKYGNAIGILADKSREAYEAEKRRLEFINRDLIRSIEKDIKTTQQQIDARRALIRIGRETVSTTGSGFQSSQRDLSPERIAQLQNEIANFQATIDGAKAQLNFLRTGSAAATDEIKQGAEEAAEAINDITSATKLSGEEMKKAREEAERQRKEAAENIRRLQLELLDETFAGRRKRLIEEAKNVTSSLVGTPEQVRQQAELVQAQLVRNLEKLEAEYKDARRRAKEEFDNLLSEIQTRTVDNAVTRSEGAIDTVTGFYDQVFRQSRLLRAAALADLEKLLAAGEITAAEFERRRQGNEREFAARQAQLQREQAAELSVVEGELLQKRLAQQEAAFQAELQQIERQKQERLRALSESIQSGAIQGGGTGLDGQSVATSLFSGEEAANLLAIEEAANQDRLAAEQRFLQEKGRLNTEYVTQQLDRQVELSEQEIEIAKTKNERLLELQRQYQDTLTSSIAALTQAFGEFVTGQEKDSKQFLKNILKISLDALQRIILIQVAAAQAQSFAQPDSVATFGATGAARAAVLTGLITATFGGIKALVETFEEGGAIPGTGTSGEGEAQGPAHSHGGIKTKIGGRVVEIEGGEHVLRNGRETYIINRRSSREFRRELSALHGGTGFNPMKRQVAEAINTFKGFGRAFAPVSKFRDGGALNISPLPFPASPSTSIAREEAFAEIAGGFREMVEATNRRIDRLKVITNPYDLVKQAGERGEIKKARSL